MHHHDRALVTSTHFLNSLSDQQLQQWKPARQPAVTMVILTCHRTVPYINVLVASLLQGQSPEELAEGLRVRVLNVERDPVLRDSHEARLLRKIPLLQYQDAATNRHAESDTWVMRGVKDYMTALRACQVGVPTAWCIIVEEDALLTSDFVWKFEEAVAGLLGDGAKTTAFVKLWTTDWWDGFENEDWPKLALMIIAAAGLLTAVVDCLCCSERRRGNHTLPLLLCFAFFVVTITVNLLIVNAQFLSQIGEQPGSLQLRPLGRHHASGTVAIAYPLHTVPRILEFVETTLKAGSYDPIDVIIGRQFVLEHPDLCALEVAPSLAQHIGVYSSGGREKNLGDFLALKQDSRFVER